MTMTRLSNILDETEQLQSAIAHLVGTLQHLARDPSQEPSPAALMLAHSLEYPCQLLAQFGESILNTIEDLSDQNSFLPADFRDWSIVTAPPDDPEELMQ